MTADNADRMTHIFSPWIEALLDHERAIEPQASGMRARAFRRASLVTVETGKPLSARESWWGWRGVSFGAALGLGLLTSLALLHAAGSRSLARSAINLLLSPTVARTPLQSAESPSQPAPQGSAPDAQTADGMSDAGTATKADHATPSVPLDEVGMLEHAQGSDAQGDFLAVLSIAAEHERLYPRGRLCEEREVLRLRALIALKRSNEARQTARRFRHDFPHSVLLPTLDGMLAPTL